MSSCVLLFGLRQKLETINFGEGLLSYQSGLCVDLVYWNSSIHFVLEAAFVVIRMEYL